MENNPRHRLLPVRAVALLCLFLPVLLGASGKPANAGAKLNEPDAKIMGEYEQIRAALAADDLRTAKKAASTMVESLKGSAATAAPAASWQPSAEALANVTALDRSRQIFKTMSVEAIRLTSGVPGYYVINCPMTPNGDWVQTNTVVDNPYMGKIMHDCGAVKK